MANSDHDGSPVDPAASGGPLSGLLVADISRVLAGPREMIEASVPRGPINTFDGGIAFAEELGMQPVVRAGQGEAAMPGVRNPITFSEAPPRYDRPPPSLDEHGDEIRRWLSQPTGAQSHRRQRIE